MKELINLLEKTFNCVYRLTDEIARNNVFNLSDIQEELIEYIGKINEYSKDDKLCEESLLRQAMEILQKKLVLKHAYTTKNDFTYYTIENDLEFNEEEFAILNQFLKEV